MKKEKISSREQFLLINLKPSLLSYMTKNVTLQESYWQENNAILKCYYKKNKVC